MQSPLRFIGRQKKRVLYTRRFINAVPTFGKPRVRACAFALRSELVSFGTSLVLTLACAGSKVDMGECALTR